MSRARSRSLVLALALAVGAPAQGLAGITSTIDGRSLAGTLTVDAEGNAKVGGSQGETALALAEIAGFEPAGAAAVLVTAPHRVWLRSGGEFACTRIAGVAVAAGKPARVALELPSGITFELPIATLRALRQGGDGRPEPTLFAADLKKPAANEDLLYVVKDGKAQRSAVAVTSVGTDTVDFLLRGDAYEFELGGVAAIVFGDNTGVAPDRQQKPRTRLELTTGEQFEGKLLGLDGGSARLRLDEGVELTVQAAKLLRVTVASDRLAWLQDLQPQAQQTPAFDRTWPWTNGRSLGGSGFQLAGRTFSRGIGMVPRTRLTYDLGGRFDRFEAMIGIDDRGGPEAHAVFRVLVDGAVAFESAPMTRGEAAQAVRVDLKKAKSLAIEADFGKNYDLGDHCAFADARVLQQ